MDTQLQVLRAEAINTKKKNSNSLKTQQFGRKNWNWASVKPK